jgi:hypothetical protein
MFKIFLRLVVSLESDHLGDPGVDWRIILKWIFKQWDGDMDWIGLDQDRDRWRAPGSIKCGEFLD